MNECWEKWIVEEAGHYCRFIGAADVCAEILREKIILFLTDRLSKNEMQNLEMRLCNNTSYTDLANTIKSFSQKLFISCNFETSIKLILNYNNFPQWLFLKQHLQLQESTPTICRLGNSIASHSWTDYINKSTSEVFPIPLVFARSEKTINATAIIATITKKYESTIENLNESIKNLQLELTEKEKNINLLKQQITDLNNIVSEQEDDTIPIKFTRKLLIQSIYNKNKTTTKNYDDDLKQLFVLLSLFGKKVYAFGEVFLGFPTFITATSYRKEIEETCFKGVLDKNSSIFSGEFDDIKLLIDTFYHQPLNDSTHVSKTDKDEDNEVVLAIDAAAIRSNIKVNDKGEVDGLIETHTVSTEEAIELVNNPYAFQQFCINHIDETVRAMFVVLLVPIDPLKKAFPLCEIKATSGAATTETIKKLDTIKTHVENLGLRVIGYGCDGDKQYMKSANIFINVLIETFEKNLNEPLFNLFNDANFSIVFYDPLHNGKNDRYYLSVCKPRFFWINRFSETFTKTDFIMVGINPMLLSEGQINKMDDNLALDLFSAISIHKCIEGGRKDLALMLLPTTLLFKGIFDTNISRNDRIRILSIAFAIIALYTYEGHIHKNENPSYTQREYIDSTGTNPAKSFPNIFCAKYLEFVHSVINQLKEKKPIRLGSLGSHLLEHWFGLIRYLTKDNFELDAFEHITKKTILYQHLCEKLEFKTKIEKRLSDSGAILNDCDGELEFKPFGVDLFCALSIIHECGIITSLPKDLTMKIQLFSGDADYNKIHDLIPKPIFNDIRKQKINTLRKINIGKVSGAKQYGNHDANEQLGRILVSETNEITEKPKKRSSRQQKSQMKGMYEKKK